MPGPESVDYIVAAAATTHVTTTSNFTNGSFNPGALPQPTIDSVSIQNGQYFLLTDQNDPNQNGLWFADPAGPIAIMTFGQGNVNPNTTIQVLQGSSFGSSQSQNGGTIWTYTASWRGSGRPGFTLTK
jgi:hypothetical protein